MLLLPNVDQRAWPPRFLRFFPAGAAAGGIGRGCGACGLTDAGVVETGFVPDDAALIGTFGCGNDGGCAAALGAGFGA